MRLLIYAMQSSGASTFCYFLGQRPDSVAVIDVWSRGVTPPIETAFPVVAKATVNMILTAADHIASFVPDRKILFVRDPVAVYASLIHYPYANRFGAIEDKFARFDAEFAGGGYDAIVRYEDFVARAPGFLRQINALGWPCDATFYAMPRSIAAIQRFNDAASPWLAQHNGDGWGVGNIKDAGIRREFAERLDLPQVAEKVAALSPNLCRDYQAFWSAASSLRSIGAE